MLGHLKIHFLLKIAFEIQLRSVDYINMNFNLLPASDCQLLLLISGRDFTLYMNIMLYLNIVTLWFNSFNKTFTGYAIIGNQITTIAFTTSLCEEF